MTKQNTPWHRIRVNMRQLEDRLAVSRQTLWRWYTAGTFPKPHYLGQNRLWWLDEIEAWEKENTSRSTPQSIQSRAQAGAA
jgi:predicted DNA-binding transcriptional regulator AlpA